MDERLYERGLRESFSHAVDKMMEDLTTRLHTVIDDLTFKLYNCFTEGERQDINASRTNIKRVEEFFIRIKTKDVDAYEKCLTAMEALNHHDLASNLREEWKYASKRLIVHCGVSSWPSKICVTLICS